ncbi:MAG: 2,3-diaminopropionate biosynthesis protein SbnB [Vicinamibacterales bacterium]
MTDELRILAAGDVDRLLRGRERELIELVRRTYLAHAAGRSVLPHATFLRFPSDAANRIIALPAYLNDRAPVAGVKWIASFPANVDAGRTRASAVLVLNSVETGRPLAVLEGSIISLRRTAASAVLAAQSLHVWQGREAMGVVGCGPVNLSIVMMLARVASLDAVWAYDLVSDRAAAFAERLAAAHPAIPVHMAADARDVLARCRLVSFATTASLPYLDDPAALRPGHTILHVSLRDFGPRAVRAADNVVDDVDHVCQAGTSVHLAAQGSGDRAFIRCTLADVLAGRAAARRSADAAVIFSPFGLGVLDLAVGQLVLETARSAAVGIAVPKFCDDGSDRSAATPTLAARS